MPRRLANGANTCSASLARPGGTGSLLEARWRKVCKRDARRNMTTRKSRENASSILRTLSVCAAAVCAMGMGVAAWLAEICARRAMRCTRTSLVVSIAKSAKLLPKALAMTSCGLFKWSHA